MSEVPLYMGYLRIRTRTAPAILLLLIEKGADVNMLPFIPPSAIYECRGTSLIRNCAPPKDHHRALGIVLL